MPRPPPPRELGKPADDLRIDIESFSVADDAPPELRASLARLTAPFVGKARSFEDLANAAAEVTRFLQSELGYYLGYAYIPEQKTVGGVVRIAVLEGRLDEVRLNWSEGLPVRREVVQAYLDELVPGSILKVRDVERAVFLVNDLRGITAQVEVQAGSKPGTATLVVTPRADATWTARADLDTNGSRFLGRFRLTGLATMNSPFGRGDGLTGNVLTSTTRGLYFGLVNYTTPVGSRGFKLGASLSAVRYQLDKEAFPLNLSGDAVTLTGFGLYPVIRSRNLNLFSLLSVEHKQFSDKSAATLPINKSSDTLALGGNGDFRDSLLSGGVNTYEFSAVTGRLKFAVQQPGQDPANFSKLTAGFTRLQNIITNRLLAYLAVRGQVGLKNLDTTEQFRLGGPDGVRAFAPGEGTGDSGFIGSLELRFLPPESIFGRIGRESVVSLFYDVGRIKYRKDPSAQIQQDETFVNSAMLGGAGIAATWVRPGEFALRLSVASRTQGTPKSDTKGGSTRAYAQLTYFIR
ncbi:ShlB/FhaC/HecB family hemolysin secretion/activation protein [Roseateles saccharophilus]|nr:ShlB/FhaC/HecB family hemolysin secretion/activation protein [Roseateles saccharophilus]MDG0835674.1 ShlB/FhaC/HecB family hemolysin secretion/activation protein [Roseateles saccharophilus]